MQVHLIHNLTMDRFFSLLFIVEVVMEFNKKKKKKKELLLLLFHLY